MADIKKLLVIIGSAKAGTTAVAHHLGSHPQIFPPRNKEPRFFSTLSDQTWTGPQSDKFRRSMVTDLDDYTGMFAGLRDDQWAIDASTDYIWRDETPQLLEKFGETRDVRVVCILRDPLERAVSEYNHTIRLKVEPLSFSRSLEAEETRRAEGWQPLFYHRRRSTVSADVRRYAQRFGDRFMVVDYADLVDAGSVTSRICGFLGLPPMPAVEMERRNESFIPRNALAKTVLRNEVTRGIGRTLLPKSLRQSIRKGLMANSRDVLTVKPAERARFQEMMADEIAACIQDPMIPTTNWTCTEPA